MKNELEKLENKSKSLEKQQKQLINSNTINERDLRGKTEDEVIEYLKNRTNKQIESKKKEKNSKITYKETVLEKDNKKNLICKICKKNCHEDCDCMYLLFWKPIFACSLIRHGKCIVCYCDKDQHKRRKKHYIEKRKEKPLPPEKQEQIDKEIEELQNSLNDIIQIQKRKERVLRKKKQINSNLDIINCNIEAYNSKQKNINDKIGKINDEKMKSEIKVKEYNDLEIEKILIKDKKKEIEKKKKENENLLNLKINEKRRLEKKENKIKELENDKNRQISEREMNKKNLERKIEKDENQLKELEEKEQLEIFKIEKEKQEIENNKKNEAKRLKELEEKEQLEIFRKEKEKQEIEKNLEKDQEKLEQLSQEMEDKKRKESKDLENKINYYTERKKIFQECLNKVKIYDEKIQNLKQRKEEKDKEKEEYEKTINEAEENKRNKEKEIEDVNKKIDHVEQKMNEKNILIERWQKVISELNNVLEKNIKNEKKKLEDEKEKIEKKLKKNKLEVIKQFLTIRIIKEELKKLSLNKETINSVSELINEFSLDKKFIDNRQYFEEIIKDYERVSKEIEESNEKEVYKRYDLDPESIRKIDNE